MFFVSNLLSSSQAGRNAYRYYTRERQGSVNTT